MPRTTYQLSAPSFVVDPNGIVRSNGGRQIDWANVNASFKNAAGNKVLPAGTCVGDLLGVGKVSPRVVTTNPAMGFLETDAVENDPAAPSSGYGVIIGGPLYEALLPDAAGSPRTLASAIKTELAASGQSTGFAFLTYQDAR